MKRGGERQMKLKRKKGILSLIVAFILLFSMTASSLAMADTQDSDIKMDALEEQATELLLEESNDLIPEEKPIIEGLLVEEEKADLEQAKDKDSLPEEPADEQAEGKEKPKVNVVKKAGQDNALDESKEPEGYLMLGPDTEDEIASQFTASSIGIMSNGSEVSVKNYFNATGTSTNDHYTVKGVYIDMDDNVHVILDNNKNTANQTRFYNPMLNGEQALGYGLSTGNYEQYWNEIGTILTLKFPDNSTSIIEGIRMFDFNFGPMLDHVQAENTLQMLNDADGFSIRGMTFTLNLGHSITKNVDKSLATTDDELIYTIVVTNTGEFRLTGVNVYDDEPSGITITAVSTDNINWNSNPVKDTVNTITRVTVATGLTLNIGEAKTFYVKAVVNESANNGDVIVNTAFTGGSVPREEDTATVTIEIKINIDIVKNVTGNFGDLTRQFPFTVAINGGTPVSFSLTHGGSYPLNDLLASDVITLTENATGYDVTVYVDGNPVTLIEGKYNITVGDMIDPTITVINHKDVVIATGIYTDSLPYFTILTIIMVLFSVVVFQRRRQEDNGDRRD